MSIAELTAPPTRASSLWQRVAARPYTVAGVALLAILAGPFLRKVDSQWDQVYVAAAERLASGGELFIDGYLYPPFMAFAAIPFTWLPPAVSRVLWYTINVVCIALLWRWAWGLTVSQSDRRSILKDDLREHAVCLLGLACALRFGIDALQNQQTDIVIGGLLLGGCLLLRESRSLAAATCFGIAAGMKCTALLWLPYLLWRRQWQAAGWLLAVAVGVNLLPNLASTPQTGGLWLGNWASNFLAPMGSAEAKPGVWGSMVVYNQSLAGAGYRAFVADRVWDVHTFSELPRPDAMSAQQLKLMVYGGGLALMAMCAVVVWRGRSRAGALRDQPPGLRDALEFSVVLLLMPLLSPMSSKPHFCTLLLPAFLLARLAIWDRQWVLLVPLLGAIASGVLATKDIAGVYLASEVMWHGGVTITASLLLAGCLFSLTVTQHSRIVPQAPGLPIAVGNQGHRGRVLAATVRT